MPTPFPQSLSDHVVNVIIHRKALYYLQEAENSPYPVTCFRIPAVVQTDSGVILAFAEARVNTCADCAELGIAMRRWT